VRKIKAVVRHQDFASLNAEFPKSAGSAVIGKRAVAVVKLHFTNSARGCIFPTKRPKGVDLAVRLQGTRKLLLLEIKGTSSEDLQWQQLKVSGNPSFRQLTEGTAVVYRVCNVFDRNPMIYALSYGVDYKLEPESRWRAVSLIRKHRHMGRT
jgi:hypothetical protein